MRSSAGDVLASHLTRAPEGAAVATDGDGGHVASVEFERSEKISMRLARTIVREISDKGLTPGTPLLPEQVMAKVYGVGRASVREALRLLEAQGLVVVRPGMGGGPAVGTASPAHFGETMTMFLQMYQTRFCDLLDLAEDLAGTTAAFAARQVKAKRTSGDRLLAIVAEEEEEHERRTPDSEHFRDHAVGFHAHLHEMVDNHVLQLTSRAILSVIGVRAMEPWTWSDAERAHVVADHSELAVTIAKGKVEDARRLGSEHYARTREVIERNHPGLRDEIVYWG